MAKITNGIPHKQNTGNTLVSKVSLFFSLTTSTVKVLEKGELQTTMSEQTQDGLGDKSSHRT